MNPSGMPRQGLSPFSSSAIASAFPSQHHTAPPCSPPHTPSLINIAGKNKTKQSKYLIRSREPQRALPPSVSSSSRSQQLPGPNEPECNGDRWQRQPPQRGQLCHIPCAAPELRLGPPAPPRAACPPHPLPLALFFLSCVLFVISRS